MHTMAELTGTNGCFSSEQGKPGELRQLKNRLGHCLMLDSYSSTIALS